MDTGIFLSSIVWLLVGGIIVYIYMSNKTSADPKSLKDEVAELKKYIDEKFKTHTAPTVATPAPGVTVTSTPASTEPVAAETKVEIAADAVTVMNNRAEDETSTTAGAKAYDDNDEILGLNKDNK